MTDFHELARRLPIKDGSSTEEEDQNMERKEGEVSQSEVQEKEKVLSEGEVEVVTLQLEALPIERVEAPAEPENIKSETVAETEEGKGETVAETEDGKGESKKTSAETDVTRAVLKGTESKSEGSAQKTSAETEIPKDPLPASTSERETPKTSAELGAELGTPETIAKGGKGKGKRKRKRIVVLDTSSEGDSAAGKTKSPKKQKLDTSSEDDSAEKKRKSSKKKKLLVPPEGRVRRKYKQRLDRKNRKQTAKNPRKRTQCPYCPRIVAYLPEHLRRIHSTHGDRLAQRRREDGQKCPLCDQYYLKVESHIRNKHYIRKNSRQYHKYMEQLYQNQVEAARAPETPSKSPHGKRTPVKSPHGKRTPVKSPHGKRTPVKSPHGKRTPVKSPHGKRTPVKSPHGKRTPVKPLAASTPRDSPASDRSESESAGIPGYASLLLRRFQEHLRGFDGGLRTASAAAQHRDQIELLWGEVSPSYALRHVMDPRKLKRWLTSRRDANSRPGTLLSYLSSLKLWCEYLAASAGSDVTELLKRIKFWNSSLQKAKKERAVEKMVDTRTLSPEEVTEVEGSQLFRDVDDINVQMQEDRFEGFTDASQLLDWTTVVIFRLGIQSGLRLGVFANLTVAQLEAAKETETGDFVIPISKHKTGYKGPVNIVLTKDMRRILLGFANGHRPQSDREELFVRMNGSPFTASRLSDLLSDRLHSMLGRRIPGTLLRKSVASEMWKKHPEARGELARSMGHSEQTASSYYLMPLAEQTASSMSRKIRGIFKDGASKKSRSVKASATVTRAEVRSDTDSDVTEPNSETPDTRPEKPATVAMSASEEETMTASDITERSDFGPPTLQTPGSIVHHSTPPTMSTGSEASVLQSARRSFTPLESATLLEMVSDRLSQRLPLTTHEILDRLGQNAEAAEILAHKSTKQLADRIRAEIRKLKRSDKK